MDAMTRRRVERPRQLKPYSRKEWEHALGLIGMAEMSMFSRMADTAVVLAEALAAERAYNRNNSGENARRRAAAMEALPDGWV